MNLWQIVETSLVLVGVVSFVGVFLIHYKQYRWSKKRRLKSEENK